MEANTSIATVEGSKLSLYFFNAGVVSVEDENRPSLTNQQESCIQLIL